MTVKLIQINLNRSARALDMLTSTVNKKNIDICLISEPNIKWLRNNSTIHTDRRQDTAIWWTGRNNTHAIRGTAYGEGFTWLEIDNTAVLYRNLNTF